MIIAQHVVSLDARESGNVNQGQFASDWDQAFSHRMPPYNVVFSFFRDAPLQCESPLRNEERGHNNEFINCIVLFRCKYWGYMRIFFALTCWQSKNKIEENKNNTEPLCLSSQ